MALQALLRLVCGSVLVFTVLCCAFRLVQVCRSGTYAVVLIAD
jgi:hypothetical protein